MQELRVEYEEDSELSVQCKSEDPKWKHRRVSWRKEDIGDSTSVHVWLFRSVHEPLRANLWHMHCCVVLGSGISTIVHC